MTNINDSTPFPPGPTAVIFDLDGTLTETELLKARSYAKVASDLSGSSDTDHLSMLDPKEKPGQLVKKVSTQPPEAFQHGHDSTSGQACANAAIRVFMNNIGATSKTVAEAMVRELNLAERLRPAMARFGVSEPWEALYALRKEIYYDTFATPEHIRESAYPHNVNLLRRAHAAGLPLAVATSSSTADAERVLAALEVRQFLRSVKGRDAVKNPKPHPEIYLATADALGVRPEQCLVFEDSVPGVRSAVAAGMHVIAVANPFTSTPLKEQTALAQDSIVYDLANLEDLVVRKTRAMARSV